MCSLDEMIQQIFSGSDVVFLVIKYNYDLRRCTMIRKIHSRDAWRLTIYLTMSVFYVLEKLLGKANLVNKFGSYRRYSKNGGFDQALIDFQSLKATHITRTMVRHGLLLMLQTDRQTDRQIQ